ncbi:MAG: hypothetical protein ACHQ2Z_05870 [Elusimicrobiota bacterium]
MNGITIINLQARFKARLADGRRVFVKANGCDLPRLRADALNEIDREKTCLDVLKGLAVPERVPLRGAEYRRVIGARSRAVGQAWIPGRDLDKAGFGPVELLGAWAFVAEHLAAFRRHQILYTDVKCRNILARRRPLSVRLIDFDLATCLSPDGAYSTSVVGYTQGFEAPEHRGAMRVTERSLVYQLGILLPHCLLGTDNSTLCDSRRGMPALRRTLKALGAASVAPIVESCLSPRVADRPRDYERVWAAIRGGGRSPLPPKALEVWMNLRAPYTRRLSEVGLHA